MEGKAKAQQGIELLKQAICDFISARAGTAGVSHADLCRDLGLESDFEGKNKNYLSWSVLGMLLADGKVRYQGERRGRRWFMA